MTTLSTPYRRAPGLLLIALLHVGLMQALLQSRRQPRSDEAPRGPAIQWLRQTAPVPVPARSVPVPTPVSKPIIVRHGAPISLRHPIVPAPAAPAAALAPAPVAETPTPALAPPAPSAADILAQAKRDVGKIDKELRKEFPQQGGEKFEDTGFKRMQQGFAEAYAAVPPKWYEASKIEEVGANAAKGSRTYKITSALGTLCVTTRAGRNGETMIGMCPK